MRDELGGYIRPLGAYDVESTIGPGIASLRGAVPFALTSLTLHASQSSLRLCEKFRWVGWVVLVWVADVE